MTDAPAPATSRNEYLSEFAILNAAAVGLTVTRTRDPYRVIEALREYAFTKKRQFYNWTMLTGWATFDTEDIDKDPAIDNDDDPYSALRKINAVGSATPDEHQMKEGIYVMTWTHFHMKIMPPIYAILAEYSRQFADQKKRLVLLMPMDWEVPIELDNSVTILDMKPPTAHELEEGYRRIIQQTPETKRPRYTPEDISRIVRAGQGTEILEFENAVSRALIKNRAILPNLHIDDFVEVVMKVKTETVKKSQVLEVMEVGHMEDVGGLDVLKDWVRNRKSSFTKEARDFGVAKPRGFTLVGPPGTGKSLAAKATAYELGIPLIKFDVGRVFNSLVGSSEARVRAALSMIASMAPCAVLMDEIDKMFNVSQGGGDSGIGMRVLGSILTFMQETEEDVFFMASANRAEGLPSELLRKGRMDEIWSVTTPNEDETKAILAIHLGKRNQDAGLVVDLAIEASRGYVGAELEAAVGEAVLESYNTKVPVSDEMIARHLRGMKPLSVAYADQFQAMQMWASQNARAASLAPNLVSAPGAAPARARTRGVTGSGGRKLDVSGLDG